MVPGSFGFTAKQTEMSWSSPHLCPQRVCGCAGVTVLCDQGMDGHDVPPRGEPLLMGGDSKSAAAGPGLHHAIPFSEKCEETNMLSVTCSFIFSPEERDASV